MNTFAISEEFGVLTSEKVVIDAHNIYYRYLNARIHSVIEKGAKVIELRNVNGQRYIANGLTKDVTIHIYGTPGNNLAAFMNGPEVLVHGNAQDQVANTMTSGKVVIYGNAGDIVAYGMRGGKVFIQGDVGYRVGIHLKAYSNQMPILIIGGTTGDFLGEYMAGGIILVLGLNCATAEQLVGDRVGSGMHGGMIITRRFPIPDYKLASESQLTELSSADRQLLYQLITEYAKDFNLDAGEILDAPFYKYIPLTHRPYKKIYTPQP
ncbi:MAG: hypothetical protein N2246_02380 [Candidatus Sumerlaeia bacterium]|nr:hypothetical protein [Candidatus Sumerlaeia bacterium]